MKKTIAILAVAILVAAGCSKPPNPGVTDQQIEKQLVGHWVIDVPQTTPRQRAMLEKRGFPPDELEDRMNKLTAVHPETEMQITSNVIAITELGQRREMLFEHLGQGRLSCRIGTNQAPILVILHDDGALNFEMTEMSYIIWRKKNHNKAIDGD
jgi:hypothetical protein